MYYRNIILTNKSINNYLITDFDAIQKNQRPECKKKNEENPKPLSSVFNFWDGC